MIIAVDIGNSRIKAGLFSGQELLYVHSAETRSIEDGFDISELLKKNSFDPDKIESIIISSVVPDANELLSRELLKQFTATKLTFVSYKDYPYSIDYSTPETLGTDRLADALGGYRRFGGPLIVVDFGTAVTFNVVDKDGAFLGGAIAPGSQLMGASLWHGTGQLPHVNDSFPESPIGKSTKESIAVGVNYGLAGLVDGLVRRMTEGFGKPLKVVATGGKGGVMMEMCSGINSYYPRLTLEGIAEFVRPGSNL